MLVEGVSGLEGGCKANKSAVNIKNSAVHKRVTSTSAVTFKVACSLLLRD